MRIASVGAGSVGATAGYACLLRGIAEAQALDLAHSVQVIAT
jgi:hypothetical protein